jgi:hypothetical protein
MAAADRANAPLARYLNDAAALITARISELADTAVRHRPPWMSLLGQPPANPARAREWERHVGVIAAYRDQYTVTSDDPRQILGPYAEPGHAGHAAYWHAAESVLAARRLADLEPDRMAASQDGRARARLAADIYRALPRSEREAIATEIAAASGSTWLGDPAAPDEHAAAQPAYADRLSAELTKRGHMAAISDPARPQHGHHERPLEADLARRGRDRNRGRTTATTSETAPQPRLEPPARQCPRPSGPCAVGAGSSSRWPARPPRTGQHQPGPRPRQRRNHAALLHPRLSQRRTAHRRADERPLDQPPRGPPDTRSPLSGHPPRTSP